MRLYLKSVLNTIRQRTSPMITRKSWELEQKLISNVHGASSSNFKLLFLVSSLRSAIKLIKILKSGGLKPLLCGFSGSRLPWLFPLISTFSPCMSTSPVQKIIFWISPGLSFGFYSLAVIDCYQLHIMLTCEYED